VRLAWPLVVVAVVSLLTSCGAREASSPGAILPSYSYSIAPPPAGSWMLEVEARIDHAPSERLVAPEATAAMRSVSLVEGASSHPLSLAGGAWLVPSCRTRCTVRYAVDLDALSASCRHMDCARRVGEAVVGTAASWMLRPEPTGDATLHVEVRGGDEARFATGLRRAPGGGYILRARELGEASYTAFGDFRRARADVPGATLDLVLLGKPLAMGDAETVGWVKSAAGCVAALFGRFPVDATVFVVPARGGDGVVFGRVFSLAGASVVLLFGTDAKPASMHTDWVAVHELFHLGTPSFVGEAHWLEEGLATYYEPILRERAGWISAADLWSHFAGAMPRGLRKAGDPPALDDRDDIDSTYWGGALFALLADVRIREQTGGAHSLDDVLRAALTELGDATHVARLEDFVRVGDAATGTHVLADLVAHVAVAGEPVDLAGLWRELGVVEAPGGVVVRKDDAPQTQVRWGIEAGGRH
jgi:predicted metalloprotease with PDZ domain